MLVYEISTTCKKICFFCMPLDLGAAIFWVQKYTKKAVSFLFFTKTHFFIDLPAYKLDNNVQPSKQRWSEPRVCKLEQ